MALILILLLLFLLFGGFGFAAHLLWIGAVVVLVALVISLIARN